jgi:hypothetical protein
MVTSSPISATTARTTFLAIITAPTATAARSAC